MSKLSKGWRNTPLYQQYLKVKELNLKAKTMKQNTTKQPQQTPPTSTEYLNEKWKIDWVEGGGDLPIWNDKECVATVWLQSQTSEVAKLIAAAPQLAKALQDMMSGYGALMAVIGEMEANVKGQEKDWHDCKLLAIDYFENAKQVLKYAGLTDK